MFLNALLFSRARTYARTYALFLHLFLSGWRGQHALSLPRNAFICRSKVMISQRWRAFESLRAQLHFSLLSLSELLLSFFFISPAASWISQEQQSHYQPKMYSSILLLPSDKGTARQVTRARGERGRKQHFSSCSAVLHVNDDQTAAGENHFWWT